MQICQQNELIKGLKNNLSERKSENEALKQKISQK